MDGGEARRGNEADRLRTARMLGLLSDEPEPALDRIVRLASLACAAPMAAISIVGGDRIWLKASVGISARETSREEAFCTCTISSNGYFAVPDARADARFADAPVVAGPAHVRAYAAFPLVTRDGCALGTLCVLYPEPRTLAPDEQEQLALLAESAVEWLDARLDAVTFDASRRRKASLLTLAEQVSQLGHWQIDVAKGSLFWSDEVYRIHGVTPASFTPTVEGAIAFYHPEDRDRVRADVERAIRDREPFSFVRRIIRADGEVRTVEARGICQPGSGGEVAGVFGVFQDVTDARRAAETLRESEARFDLAVRAAGVGIFDIHFEQGVRAFWSDQLYRMLGYEPSEVEPSREAFLKLIHPDDVRRTSAVVRAHVQIRSPLHVECRIRHKTEGYRWFRMNGQAVWSDAGEPVRLTGTMLDIHDLRLAQEQAEIANVAKSQFLAAMSHEIRTPLNGVIGLISSLRSTALDAKQRRLVDVIDTSGEALLNVIDKILDLSEIESGRMRLECEAFDVTELAGAVCGPHAAAARRKGLSFKLAIADEAAGRFVGDHARLRQVLDHIVGNAIKFTDRGEVSVSVERGATREDDAVEFLFEVRDTGIGISHAARERLFAPFTQVDSSNTRRYGGTGLGLAICRRICESMGGAIDVESAPGQGSAFRFVVAVEECEALDTIAEADGYPMQAVDGTASERPIRILAADDHPNNRIVLEALFSSFNAELTFVENGREAVSAWAAREFDLILMDIQMPVMDGIRATQEIRRVETETGRARTPIIAVTANAMTHQVAEYLSVGMDSHVPKPIKSAALFEAICSALTSEESARARPAAAV